ncbi:hypothetical protein KJ639_00965 [Patescibacteria group bacterium]|nr:hypothetical protein [Patescibacteria group bacterium]
MIFEKKRLLKFLILFFAAIFVLHGVACYFSLYWRIWWFDGVLHFLGGSWLGFFMIWLSSFSLDISLPRARAFFVLAIILGMSALGGVLWEFHEFLFDYFIAKEGHYLFTQLGVADTMSDLFFDLIGGLAAGLVFLKKRNKNEPK